MFLLFAFLGVLTLARLSVSVLRCCYVYFLRRPKDLKSRYGSWALVTGCTDGIGKAIAYELARNRLNLVLVGRNPDKLSAVSAAIAEAYGDVRVKNVVVDLSGDSRSIARLLKEEIEGLDVGVVVNCAGVVNARAEFFHEKGMETWMEIVRVNLEAATEVIGVVLEGMMERRRGSIVNIGSASGSALGVPSFPLFDVYAGTKAYLNQLSKCLHVEYKNKGIDVQCQIPFFVDTKMVEELSDLHSHFLAVATPAGYARAAVRWIGYERECMPYFPHFLEHCLVHSVPKSIANSILLHLIMNHGKS